MKDLASEDIGKVCQVMDELAGDAKEFRANISKLWEKCIFYVNGDQDNYPQTSSIVVNNQFTNVQNNSQNRRRRMYQTNEIEPIIRTLVSYMTRAKPAVEVAPADETDETSKRRADIGERVLEAKYDMDHEYNNSTMASHWALTIGTVYRKDYWDPSVGNLAELPNYDEQGNSIIDPQTNRVQTREMNIGGSATDILTPFTVSRDLSALRFDKIEWIEEMYMVDVDWVKAAFNRNEPGYTGKANEITAATELDGMMSTFENLKYHVPFGSRGGKRTGGSRVPMREFYARPSAYLQKGRLIIKAGDVAVYDSFNRGDDIGSPYYFPAQQVCWHPYTEWGFEPYIGRAMYKGLVEQLLSLQGRLNEINGAILENANTMAKVDILAAENQLKRGTIKGGGANVFTYRPRPDAPAPKKWPGEPLPSQFFKEKEDIVEQMVRIAGTNFVMQGDVPRGVSAAAAIQMLLENANTQHSDLMNSWEKFHEQGYTKKLRLIRNFNRLPDRDLIDYVRTLARDAMIDDMNAFIGEDLGDGWSIKVEAGSMIPKSEKFKKDIYREFAQAGLLGPVGEDSARGAKLRKELLTKFGESGFETDESSDVEKAKWENEQLRRNIQVPVDEFDNDEIHLDTHMAEWKDPKYIERASPEVKQNHYAHMKEHINRIQQKQAEMAQQQAMMGGPPPGAPEGPPSEPVGPLPDMNPEARVA